MTHFSSRRWGIPTILICLVGIVAAGPVSAAPRGPGSTGSAASGTWKRTGSMHDARESHTATLLQDGRVLVAGGSGLSSAELYDPTTGTWSATGSLHDARYGHTATRLQDGRVLVAGGCCVSSRIYELSSAEVYDPAAGTWSATSSLHDARKEYTATWLQNEKVLVAGGCCLRSSAELYFP